MSARVFFSSLVEEKKQAITTDFIIYSCLIVAQNNGVKSIKDIVVFFNSLPNLNIIRPTLKDMYDACEIMSKNKLDFDDSLVVSCVKNYGATELVSLDSHFDRVKDIRRIVP
ncbi:type II toxin-antitoxin system VapC family toxin [Candidatus Woesearchaeota archaeon]|nr:type II toxin-antitoxin system VapC family toxin [Candidatus Woesearchaeota archaeon]